MTFSTLDGTTKWDSKELSPLVPKGELLEGAMTTPSDAAKPPMIALLSTGAANNYMYVFGAQRGAERHDPHLRKQRPAKELDLREVAELLRTGTPAAQGRGVKGR